MMIFNLLVCSFIFTADSPSTIDSIVDAHLASIDALPQERCTDQQFVRRITLDLIGRIPTQDELQRFTDAPDRARKIDELLESDEFPEFLSEIWTAALVGYLNVFGTDREALKNWLVNQFSSGVPFDEIARSLITARGNAALDGPVNFLVRNRYDPVVKVGRVFLGVRLDCAQCHDHPFDRWTQEDYQQMRRFFGQLRVEQRAGSITVRDELRRVPENQRPTFLTGARPRTSHWRAELALYATSSKPFARTFANRMWYHLMGRGIVHPIDDFNEQNPAVVPELMTYLADQVKKDGFSPRKILRLICNSRVYQRSSARDSTTDYSGEVNLAVRALKPMTPEQYIDSVSVALDWEISPARRQRFIRSMIGDALQQDFNPSWDYRETIQMAMSRLSLPLPADEWPVETVYQRILSRDPSQRERELCKNQPMPSIVFALINSNEFFFNH